MSDRNGNRLVGPRGPVLLFPEGRGAAAGMRRLRKKAGLTQEAFAPLLGCPLAWIKAREQGSVRMTRDEADKVAAAFGTDFEGLLASGAQGSSGRRAA